MANKDAIKSLMQYRFNRSPDNKLKKPLVTKPVGVKAVLEAVASEPETIPDTPEKHWPSPVKAEKCRVAGIGKAVVIESDDESLTSTNGTTSNPTSVESSPWLNKNVGHLMNGKSHAKKKPPPSPPSETSQSESQSSEDDWRTRLENVNKLKAAFPAHERTHLEQIWDRCRDYDDAVTAVIADIGNPTSMKRGPPEEDSPIKAPQRKRIRILSESSNDDTPTSPIPSKAEEIRNLSIRNLHKQFPDRSREEVIEALEKTKYNLNNGAKYLRNGHLSSPPPQPPPIVHQRSLSNPSSLKDQKAIIKKNTKVISIESSSDEEFAHQNGAEEGDDDSDSDVQENDSEPVDTGVLEFFNSATVDECLTMPGCSRKKAEAIVALKPFSDWQDLLNKFSQSRLITASMISNCKELISMRQVVLSLMKKCRKISQQIEVLVSQLTSHNVVDSSSRISKQPHLLDQSLELKPYQMVGLNWLVLLHGQQLSGILADEMGLGKTVQAISLLAHLLGEGDKGPHIIVVPSSTVENWLRELRRWCPALEVVLYYGSQEERRALRYQLVDEDMKFHVLLTTYNMTCGTLEDRNLFKRYDFTYAIFDEAHMLKNMSSQRYASLMRTKASRRLLLTGTPLQNNLVELISLLAFVMPNMFTSTKSDYLKKMFTTFTKGEDKGRYEQARIQQAKDIMKPFVLRRLKAQVLSQLPRKLDHIRQCPLTPDQRLGYDQCVERIKRRLADSDDTASANHLMELRKWANHPLLQRRLYTDDRLRTMAKRMMQDPDHVNANEDYIYEDMEVMSDFELSKTCQTYPCIREFKLSDDVVCDSGKFIMLDEMLPEMLKKGDRVLLFSQFTMVMDVMEVYMKKRSYKYLRLDGQTPVIERQDLIDRFNTERDLFVFLLSTRAGGLGINLTSANTVIMHDIDFNPYNDKQAEDRCHRLGQTRDVHIYRLISEGTIEEDILATAQRKLKLEQDITGNEQAGDKGNTSDVASLLRTALHINKNKSLPPHGKPS